MKLQNISHSSSPAAPPLMPLADNLFILIKSGQKEKADEWFDQYSKTSTAAQRWTLLTDLNSCCKKDDLDVCKKMDIDFFWIKFASAFLSEGNLTEPTKILIEGLRTPEHRLHSPAATINLLEMIAEKHLESNDINAMKSLIDAIKTPFKNPLESDFLTEHTIKLTALHCIKNGLIQEAIEISKKEYTLHDTGRLLLSLVTNCIQEENLSEAKELAEAIPIAPFLTSSSPRAIDKDIPESRNREIALDLLSVYTEEP